MNRSRDFKAYVLVDSRGKIPVMRGEIPIYWTKTAAESGLEEYKDGGHAFSIERVQIVRHKPQ